MWKILCLETSLWCRVSVFQNGNFNFLASYRKIIIDSRNPLLYCLLKILVLFIQFFSSSFFVYSVTFGNAILKVGKRIFATSLTGTLVIIISSHQQEVHFSLWKLFCSIPSVKKSSAFLSKNPFHGKIVGVGSVESSFLYQTTRCIDSFDHPDLAPIMVFLECLTTLEVSCVGSPGCSHIPD